MKISRHRLVLGIWQNKKETHHRKQVLSPLQVLITANHFSRFNAIHCSQWKGKKVLTGTINWNYKVSMWLDLFVCNSRINPYFVCRSYGTLDGEFVMTMYCCSLFSRVMKNGHVLPKQEKILENNFHGDKMKSLFESWQWFPVSILFPAVHFWSQYIGDQNDQTFAHKSAYDIVQKIWVVKRLQRHTRHWKIN